jgi:hypothetical protein
VKMAAEWEKRRNAPMKPTSGSLSEKGSWLTKPRHMCRHGLSALML